MISRYEIKFLVTSAQKQAFLRLALAGLLPDEHGDNDSASYRITSLYYDSPDHYAYWEKQDGEGVRQKVRLRYYGELRETPFTDRPFFMEVKHRIKDSVYKDRIPLRPDSVEEPLNQPRALAELTRYAIDAGRGYEPAIQNIGHLAETRTLRPTAVISYVREAWLGAHDDRLRITFDRLVHAYEPWRYAEAGADSGYPLLADTGHVLELKFNQAIPRWVRDIVIELGLAPQRFSKYAAGVDALARSVSADYRNSPHRSAHPLRSAASQGTL